MTNAATSLAPVSGKARIDVLDAMRGIAILGIFFMNIPFMGASLSKLFVDVHRLGWSPVDAASWTVVQLFLEGTQRGLLELLFGAGMMVLTARAMTPDGPVAVADLYWRRNLWLLAFGFVDIFLLLWSGDILHIYALAALFLFPFRKLGPKLLLALGLGYAAFVLMSGAVQYQERVEATQAYAAAHAKEQAKAPLTAADKKALEAWKKIVDDRTGNSEDFKQLRDAEPKAHAGTFLAYAEFNIGLWFFIAGGFLLSNVCEAFCVMLIGIALWKWQVIQGGRSTRFYWTLLLACYPVALALRYVAAQAHLTMVPIPRIEWMSYEIARILMSVGHVALINLAFRSGAGRMILAPFKAAGRTAFSLYFMQQIVGLWILFAPWGVGLWDKLGWSGLYAVVLAVIAAQLVIANLWLTVFATGPLEWAWRSLSYVRWQPFLRKRAAREPVVAPAVAAGAVE